MMEECPEHAGAGEDVMESDSGSAEDSDDEDAAVPKAGDATDHGPDGEDRGVRGHDQRAARDAGTGETLGEE